MSTTITQNQKGFTLVEIGVVLVIISLLLGGVLKGQELITNAKIKSVINDLEGLVIATEAYQDRTNRMPGWNEANSYNTGTVGPDKLFWRDLRQEGFLTGKGMAYFLAKGTKAPLHKLDGTFIVSEPTTFFGEYYYICATEIPEDIAQTMDSSLDDGVPNTGLIRIGSDINTLITSYSDPDALRLVCKSL